MEISFFWKKMEIGFFWKKMEISFFWKKMEIDFFWKKMEVYIFLTHWFILTFPSHCSLFGVFFRVISFKNRTFLSVRRSQSRLIGLFYTANWILIMKEGGVVGTFRFPCFLLSEGHLEGLGGGHATSDGGKACLPWSWTFLALFLLLRTSVCLKHFSATSKKQLPIFQKKTTLGSTENSLMGFYLGRPNTHSKFEKKKTWGSRHP